jgi:hypothetical protein
MRRRMIVYFALLLTSQFASVMAQTAQQFADDAKKVQRTWQARLAQAPASGMPRLSSSRDAPLIGSVFDLDRLGSIGSVTAADVPHLLDACGLASSIMKSYLYWSQDGAPPDAAVNEVLYAPELALGGAYVIRCFGYTADATRLFMASLPADQLTDVRRQGAIKAQTGMMQMVMGFAMVLNQPHLSLEQKLIVAHALEDAVPRFAIMSTNENKAVLAASLSSYLAASSDAPVKAVLERTIAKVQTLE